MRQKFIRSTFTQCNILCYNNNVTHGLSRSEALVNTGGDTLNSGIRVFGVYLH